MPSNGAAVRSTMCAAGVDPEIASIGGRRNPARIEKHSYAAARGQSAKGRAAPVHARHKTLLVQKQYGHCRGTLRLRRWVNVANPSIRKSAAAGSTTHKGTKVSDLTLTGITHDKASCTLACAVDDRGSGCQAHQRVGQKLRRDKADHDSGKSTGLACIRVQARRWSRSVRPLCQRPPLLPRSLGCQHQAHFHLDRSMFPVCLRGQWPWRRTIARHDRGR